MSDFNAVKTKDACVQWIRDYFNRDGKGCKAIVGISGGKDSAVVAALCCEALGKDRVAAVLMPNGKQADIDDSLNVINHLGIACVVYANIGEAFQALRNGIYEFKEGAQPVLHIDCGTNLPAGHVSEKSKMELMSWHQQSIVNTPARLRMTVLYAVAASYNGRVANTCNRSEDVVGYATLYGDSAGDFSPLSKLTVTEVIAIGKALGLPDKMVNKTPADGLCGVSDEESLGITYKEIDEYLREGKHAETIGVKVNEMYRSRGAFKLALINIPCYNPCLPDSISLYCPLHL